MAEVFMRMPSENRWDELFQLWDNAEGLPRKILDEHHEEALLTRTNLLFKAGTYESVVEVTIKAICDACDEFDRTGNVEPLKFFTERGYQVLHKFLSSTKA